MAQVKILSCRQPASLDVGQKVMESSVEACEDRLKQLEKKLDAFVEADNKSKQISMAARLFHLNEEDRRAFNDGDKKGYQGIPPIPQPPLRVMKMDAPKPMAPISLNLASARLNDIANGLRQRVNDLPEDLGDEVRGLEFGNDWGQMSNLVKQIQSVIQKAEESTDTEEAARLARQVSQGLSDVAFKEIPKSLGAEETSIVQSVS